LIIKLSRYLGEYKKYVLIVPLTVFLVVACELSIPLLMAKIIDVGIANQDIAYIARTGLYMVLLALAAICFGILNMRFTSTGSMGFGANLRSALFEKVQKYSFKNIDHFSTASLVTRLTNDVNVLQFTFMMGMRILLRAPMILMIAFILAYNINARLSLVLALAISLLVVGVAVIMRTAGKRFAKVQEKLDALNKTIQENLIGIRVVKAFVREPFEIQKFKKSNDEFTEAAIRAVNVAILNMPVMMLVMNGATLAIIWQGGQMVYWGGMGAGELLTFISYAFQILFSVMMISMIFIMGARAQASGHRILEVLETEVDIIDLPGKNGENPQVHSGRIEFHNVSFRYNPEGSGENVLSDINLSIEPGEVVGIVGGTGTGKSTLVHLIPRLYDVTQGAVCVDGVDVRDYRLEDLRRSIGIVLQKNTLFSGTIRENLLWGNENATQEEIEAACKAAQAHDFIMSFPDGYETQLGQGGVNLSGGQKQRLCIARAMLKKPKILILDDSTSAVDSTTEAKIRAAFYQNLAGTTVLIIAQRISSVQEADKIIVLDDGRIAGIGTHAELLASNTIYQEIYHSQQEGVLVQ